MELSHFSSDPIKLSDIHSTDQKGEHFKPVGLWVSVDGENDWPSWCRSEDFGGVDTKFRHRVQLSKDANILYLDGIKDILAFDKEYQIDHYDMDWYRISKKYDGIIVLNYSREFLTNYMVWYYAWDCSSGCIWNKSAIESIELLTAPIQEAIK